MQRTSDWLKIVALVSIVAEAAALAAVLWPSR
jgi:hypothetical protein